MACNSKYTLTYKKTGVNGWTSFHSWSPECMIGMGGKFFSFKGGNLYVHHSDNVNRNTFYGTQYASKLNLILNDMPSDVKVFEYLQLEGSDSWNALVKAYIDSEENFNWTDITSVEFEKKEGMWFAYMRGNQDTTKMDPNSTYGIGTAGAAVGLDIPVSTANSYLTIGDEVYRDDMLKVGTITAIADGVITVDAVLQTTNGSFLFGRKNARVEGGEMRGYAAEVELDVTSNDKVELFAVNSEVFKSFG